MGVPWWSALMIGSSSGGSGPQGRGFAADFNDPRSQTMLPAHVAERFPPLFRRLTPGRLCDRALSLKLAPRFIPTLSRERAAVGWSLPSFLGQKFCDSKDYYLKTWAFAELIQQLPRSMVQCSCVNNHKLWEVYHVY
jgi:hypothetical protein